MPDWRRLIQRKLPDLSEDPALEAEILDELEQHLEARYQSVLAGGKGRREALRDVLQEFEWSETALPQIRHLKKSRPSRLTPPPAGVGAFTSLRHELVYSLRSIRRHPLFSSFVILILAVGIASTTAIFSVVHGLLLRSLPYPESDRIVVLGHASTEGRPGTIGFATLEDWAASSKSFEDMAAIRSWSPTLAAEEGAERVGAVRVSSSYFSVLRVQPALGRDFRASEDRPGQGRVVILSSQLWRELFGSDPDIVGRTLILNDGDYQVVGVMPEDFQDLAAATFYEAPELWAPLAYDLSLPWACRTCQHLRGIGRLLPGASLESATSELVGIQERLNREFKDEYESGATAAVTTLQEELNYPIRPALNLLAIAVCLLLLISLANVANLFMARSLHRRKEFCMRAAIGAGRLQILRQLLVESSLFGLLAGLAALGLTPLAIRFLLSMAPPSVYGREAIGINGAVVLFTLGVALCSGVLFGLAPGFFLLRQNVVGVLRQEGRATPGRAVNRSQKLLVTVDLMLAMALLCGSLLMLQTVNNLLQVDPGFRPTHLLTGQISFQGQKYAEEERLMTTVDSILESLSQIPGVTGASATSQMPLAGNRDAWGMHRRDRPEANPAESPFGLLYVVTPDYFDVMGIELVAGRLLQNSDRSGAPSAMLLAESTAERLWPGEDPLGKQIRIGVADEGPWWTVVGLVREVRHKDLASRPELQMYVPLAQRSHPYLTLAIRTSLDTSSIVPLIRGRIAEVAPDVPVFGIVEMRELVARVTADQRFVSILLTAFASAALLLTAAGIYGLASYSVSQRTHELGVRVALGARRRNLADLILRSGLRLALVGLAGGFFLIWILSRFLEQLLFGVGALDLSSLLLASLILLAILLLSHLFPLRRALRVDPATVLREE